MEKREKTRQLLLAICSTKDGFNKVCFRLTIQFILWFLFGCLLGGSLATVFWNLF